MKMRFTVNGVEITGVCDVSYHVRGQADVEHDPAGDTSIEPAVVTIQLDGAKVVRREQDGVMYVHILTAHKW